METQIPKEKRGTVSFRKEITLLAKNSIIYMIGNVLSRAVGFFMIPIYTRFIAPTNYGAMELIEILASIAGITISMGISDSMSRFYYEENEKNKRNEVVSSTIIGFSLMGIPIVFIFLILSNYISKTVMESSYYRYCLQLAISAVWFTMLCEIGYTYLRMTYRAKLFVTISIIQLFIALSLNILFVVFFKLNILGVFYSTLITQSLIGLTLSIGILKKTGIKLSLFKLWNMIKFGLPLIPSRVGLMLGFVSNRFFLRWLGHPDPAIALAQVGLYSLGHKFGVIVNRFVNVPFNSFWGPRRFELLLNDASNTKKIVARVCTYAAMSTTFIALLLSVGVENVIEIMADPKYNGAHIVVPFVALSYVALGLETHFITGILLEKKTRWATYITICSLFIVIIWNYLFVPKYGLIGAATSNLAAFIIRLLLIYIVSQKIFYIPFEIKRIISLLLISITIYIITQNIHFSSPYLSLVIRETIAIVSFWGLLFLIRFYDNKEIEFIQDVIRKVCKLVNIHLLHV